MLVKINILKSISLNILILFFSLNCIGCSNQDQQHNDKSLEQGINRIQKRNLDEGIKLFNKMIETDPDNYMLYYQRGIAYRDIKDYENAIADFQKCINLKPNDSGAYFQLGGVWSDQGEIEKSISFYSKAIEVEPSDIEAYASMGIMKTMVGRINSGIEDLNKALKINPSDPLLYFVRAQIKEVKGDCEGAIDDYEKSMSFDPDSINLKINIAWILAACPESIFRDGKKALNISLETIKTYQSDSIFRTLAAAYAEVGDFKNALIYQEKAIKAIKEVKHGSKLSKTYHENNLKKYIEQLESYKNNIPWYFKKS